MKAWFKSLRLPRPTGQALRTAALFMGAPLFGGLLAWQLRELDPKRACDMGFFIASKSPEVSFLQAFNGCLGIYSKIIDVRDHAILMLGAVLGIGYMMMMMRELRMQGEMSGPLGWGAKFRSDDDKDAAPTVTTTTTVAPTTAPPSAPPPEGSQKAVP